jgi:hypothetical protein
MSIVDASTYYSQYSYNKSPYVANEKIPLISVIVDGSMIDNVGKVTITQQYKNNNTSTIEALYVFNLTENDVVTDLKLVIGSRVLSAQVQEKSEARQTYNDAKVEKKTTCLLEKFDIDSYRVNLGTLSPSETISVVFSYLTELSHTENGFKYILPTNIAPRYDDQNKSIGDLLFNTVFSSISYSSSINYTFELSFKWLSNNKILSARSLTNEINVIEGSSDKEILIKSNTAPKMGDFNLFVETEISPVSYLYQEGEFVYSMTTHQIPSTEMSTHINSNKEFVFVLDRSGSMNEPWTTWSGQNDSNGSQMTTKIEYALSALEMFLTSLPPNSSFNVVSFGTAYSALYQKSVPLTNENLAEAIRAVKSFGANMGGTQMYDCLSDILNNNINVFNKSIDQINLEKRSWIANNEPVNNEPVKNEQLNIEQLDTLKITRETNKFDQTAENEEQKDSLEENSTNTFKKEKIIVLLTDGQISNTMALVQLADRFNHVCRIFTIGIGSSADRKLVEQLSKITNGLSQMLVDSADIESTVIKLLDSSLKTYYTNLNYQRFMNDGSRIITDNTQSNSVLYPDNVITIFDKLPIDVVTNLGAIKLDAVDGHTNVVKQWTLTTNKVIDQNYIFIKQLYANNLIKYGKLTKQQIVKLSIDNHIMNNLTSFVVVDNETIKSEGVQKSVNVAHYSDYSSGIEMERCGELMQQAGSFRCNVVPLSKSYRSSYVLNSSGSSNYSTSSSLKSSGVKLGSMSVQNSGRGRSSTSASASSGTGIFSSMINSLSNVFGSNNKETAVKTNNTTKQTVQTDSTKIAQIDSTKNIPKITQKLNHEPTFDPKIFMSIKRVDGSFKFEEHMIEYIGLSRNKFFEILTKFNITNEQLFNIIIYINFDKLTEQKYKLILKNLKTYIDQNYTATKGLGPAIISGIRSNIFIGDNNKQNTTNN